jgi:hypothetical protein
MNRPQSKGTTMKNLPSALGWIGLTLFLLPVAVICLALMVALIVTAPVAGIIFGCIVFLVGRGLFGTRS